MTKAQARKNQRVDRAARALSEQMSPYLTSTPRTVVVPCRVLERALEYLRRLGHRDDARSMRAALRTFVVQSGTYRIDIDVLSRAQYALRWRVGPKGDKTQ